jgi:hydrogenase maturation protease
LAKEIEVICCGNILASDDGIGPIIAKELQSLSLPENVEVIDAGTPGLALLNMILEARKAIIVDATITGARPGTIRKLNLDQLETTRKELEISLHDLSIIEALRMAREVFPEKMPRELVVIGIEAESTAKPRIGLTKNVEKAVPEAVEAVLYEIQKPLSHN